MSLRISTLAHVLPSSVCHICFANHSALWVEISIFYVFSCHCFLLPYLEYASYIKLLFRYFNVVLDTFLKEKQYFWYSVILVSGQFLHQPLGGTTKKYEKSRESSVFLTIRQVALQYIDHMTLQIKMDERWKAMVSACKFFSQVSSSGIHKHHKVKWHGNES